MKKHQLLEKAMRDYPKGTVARFKSAPGIDHTSDGIFKLLDVNQNGKIGVFSGSGLNCFYSEGEWAVPVTPSILSGKCAIQVNNEREFKLLMEHYEAKGWKAITNTNSTSISYHTNKPKEVEYKNGFTYMCDSSYPVKTFKDHGYTIIPFSDFAAEVGISVPMFVCTSEDGVDLYEGDDFSYAFIGEDKKWQLGRPTRKIVKGDKNQNWLKNFSTKQAAELWIKEANKTKEIRLTDNNCNTYAIVNGNGFIAHVNRYNSAQLEKIYNAHQELTKQN